MIMGSRINEDERNENYFENWLSHLITCDLHSHSHSLPSRTFASTKRHDLGAISPGVPLVSIGVLVSTESEIPSFVLDI